MNQNGLKNIENSSDLKEKLLKESRSFSFFQIIRLLKKLNPEKSIKLKSNLSLSFPVKDVEKVDEDDEKFTVTANFLGLYGASSPLPVFYTEDLMEEMREDGKAARDFLDILNGRLYELLFAGWCKYRNLQQMLEEKNEEHIGRLFCFIGLGEKTIRDKIENPHSLLRYVGLFTQFPSSASGLKSLLSDAFEGIDVAIVPCLERKGEIPRDQRCFLGKSGNVLGDGVFLGQEIASNTTRFRIRLGPVTESNFRRFFWKSKDYNRLVFLTKFYIKVPLIFDVEIILKEDHVKTVCLGQEKWSRLGLDTWMFSGEHIGEVSTVF